MSILQRNLGNFLFLSIITLIPVSSFAGQWSLDEGSGTSASDTSGDGVDLTVNNGGGWIAGQFGSALNLNGTSQDASTSSATILQTPSMSLSAWIYPNSNPADSQWEWVAAQGDNFGLYLIPGNRRATFYIKSVNGGWSDVFSSDNSFEFDKWQHIAGSFDNATKTLRVYVDGVEVGTSSFGNSTQAVEYTTGDGFTIGSMQGGRFFDGRIDEVQSFDFALSQAEVTALATPTPAVDTTDPVITLIGANPVTVIIGTTYTDAGATVTDNADPNVALDSPATSNVDPSAIGTYQVTYTATDASNNTATKTRTVNVVAADTTGPVITLNGTNPVTITVGTNYTDAGATAVDNIDGVVTVAVDASNVNTQVAGTYQVNFTASDNASTPNTTTVTRTVIVVDAPAIPGSIGQWPLDENQGTTAQDQSSSGVDLTVNGGATWTAGQFGSALNLNGTSQDASTANASVLQSTSVTLAGWGYPNSNPADSQWEWIAAQGDNYGLYISPGNRSVTFYIRNTSGGWTGVVTPGNSFQFDEWSHFAGTYDETTQVLKVFVNGVELATASTGSSIEYDTGDGFTIGSMQNQRYFDGQLDEIQLFDTALTEAQIGQLATGPSSNQPPVAVLTGNPLFGEAPLEDVFFDAGGSTDPDDGIFQFEWTFSDAAMATFTTSAASPTFSHTFTNPGTHTATVKVIDNSGASDSDTVSITVSGVNQAPTATADNVSTATDTATAAIAVLANDTDPDSGDTLTVISNTNPSSGTVIQTGNTFVYTPNTGFNGSDSFTYTISDGNTHTATATVTITVSPAPNQPPVASLTANPTSGESPLAVLFDASGSTDADDGIKEYLWTFGDGSSTQLTSAATATFSHTYTGVQTYLATVEVFDNAGDSNVASVTVNVVPENQAPTAVNDAAVAPSGSATVISVLANDTDPDGDTLTVTGNDTAPVNGSVQQAGNTFVYTPNAGFTGTDSFVYAIDDGNGNAATATVNITVVDATIPGSIGQWPLDENQGTTAADQSSSGVDLTLNGSLWVTGKSGSALEFNGGQDASAANAAALQTSSVTVSAWVFPDSNPANSQWEWIAAQGDNYGLYLTPGDNGMTFYIKNTSGGWTDLGTPNVFAYDEWQHVAGSYDAATRVMKIYVNGVEVASRNAGSAIEYSTGDGFTIGSMQGGRNFDGFIDEVNVHNSALSQSQIDQLAEVAPAVDTTAPVITLNGINPVSVLLNSTYTDANATALDNVDGVVAVTVDQTAVDTSVAANYTVVFTAVDSSGNTASATRTVQVVDPANDTEAPVITLVGANPVTVTLDSIYNDAGATATDNLDATVTVADDADTVVDTSVAGTYVITYTATDSANNVATPVTRTVNVVAVPVIAGLTGQWLLNENQGTIAADQSSNAIDLTLNNASWITAGNGAALSLNGLNQDASTANATALQTPSVTLSAWVYPSFDAGNTDWEWVAAQGDNFGLYLTRDNQRVNFYIKDVAGGWSDVVSTNATFVYDQWQHIAGSFDASTQILTVYVNGIVAGTSSFGTGLEYSTGDGFTIGSMQNQRFFDGRIDEVQVFDSALDQADIDLLSVQP